MPNPMNALHIQAQQVDNPFEGVSPTLNVFGAEFNTMVAVILGGLWAIALVFVAAGLVMGLAKWGVAKRTGHSDDLTDGANAAKKSAVALGCLVGVPTIVGAIIFVASI